MTVQEFKSFVKHSFKGMKIRFTEKSQGTAFEEGGKVLSAFIKVGWDYELSDELYNRCVENNISTGGVNSELRLTILID